MASPPSDPETPLPDTPDGIDTMRERLAELYPDLDTSAFGVTGRVLRLAQAIDRRRAEHLKEFNLAPGDFDVLATVRRIEDEDGVNPGRLLQSVLITSGGLTKRLDRLETAGWVARHPDPDDRRATLVRLTDGGRELIDTVLPELLTREHEFLSDALSDRQRDQVAGALRRIVRTLPDG